MPKGSYLELIGGEVGLLSPLKLANLINLVEYPFFIIQTNGTLFSSDYLDVFEAFISHDKRIAFSVSIDGPEVITDKYRGKGVYKRVLKNSLELLNRGYCIQGYGVLYEDLDLSWVDSLPFKWRFQLPKDGLSIERQKELAKQLLATGKEFLYNELMPNLCVHSGNKCSSVLIADEGFSPCDRTPDIWVDSVRLCENYFKDYLTNSDCVSCEIHSFCNSGCPAWRQNGKALGCTLLKELITGLSNRYKVSIQKMLKYLWRLALRELYHIPTMGEIRKWKSCHK